MLHSYAEQIKAVVRTGVQVGIVIGGGNIFRGLQGARKGFDRVKGDQMGMLATIINSLALQSALEDNGVKAKVLTSIRMEPIGEYYSKAKALDYLEAGYVVIIGGGTSNPYFSTDSASALRGIEIEADVLSIPEQIVVSVEDKEAGYSISAAELDLPEGVTLISDPETLIIAVNEAQKAETESDDDASEPAETGTEGDTAE